MRCLSEVLRDWFLKPVLDELKKQEATMVTKEELEAGLDSLGTKITEVGDALVDLAGDQKKAFDKLKADIEAGQTGADLGPSLTAVGSFIAKLDTLATAVKAMDTDAETISGTQTPPVA